MSGHDAPPGRDDPLGLDTLGLVLPLPYRVGLITVLAVWGWAVNLHVLAARGIDVPRLIRYPARASPHQQPLHHVSTYRLAAALSSLLAGSIVLFWALTRGAPDPVLAHDWLPLGFLLVLAAVLVVAAPLPGGLSGSGRRRLLSTLRRISLGGLAKPRDGRFADILLADVLTSYARVLADLYVSLCMFARAGGSATARPDHRCGAAAAVPLIAALPSAIRLRQCLIEFLRARRGGGGGGGGWGGQHLANAAKYATAFPVIALGYGRPPGRGFVAAALLNSLYSFYWDVAKDWDLTLFSPRSSSSSSSSWWAAVARSHHHHPHPYGLRRTLVLGPAVLYYAAIALDLALRCTWMLRLSGRLGSWGGIEGSAFLIEVLEVVRRWIWVFFRVETEWVRGHGGGGGGTLSASPGELGGLLGQGDMDILLGDYHGKDDEESD